MKKILFMLINMNVGGTEKALLNLISQLPRDMFEITIMLLEKSGKFIDFIPAEVNVEYLVEYESIKDIINEPPLAVILDLIMKRKIIKAFSILFLYIIFRITKVKTIFYRYLLKDSPIIRNKYDIAVAYAGPMELITYYILNKVLSKRKIQWIHADITKVGYNKKFTGKMYNKYDKIYIASEQGRNKFISIFPNLKNKTNVFLNFLSSDLILNQSHKGKGFDDDFIGKRILTVGRLSIEKGQDLVIPILARLVNEGYNVKWYCVGEGSAREYYENLIKHYNLKDRFILLGQDPNPYSYMKQCDIYVQPSRYECYCTTISEVKFFCKPIIMTNVNGAEEQLRNYETGLIVNIDQDELYISLKLLLDDYELCGKFEQNLSKFKIDEKNNSEICKEMFLF